MLLLAIKDEELESEKEKGIQTRSMLKKVEEEKIKIENEKDEASFVVLFLSHFQF